MLVFGNSAISESLSAEMKRAMFSESADERTSDELGSGSGVGLLSENSREFGNSCMIMCSDFGDFPPSFLARPDRSYARATLWHFDQSSLYLKVFIQRNHSSRVD